MPTDTVAVTVRQRAPIHPFFVPFPIAFFTGALATDLIYWRSADMMWANFSAWLLAAGLGVGALGAIAGLIDLLGRRTVRRQGVAWLHAIGSALVLTLAGVNLLVHSRDAYTSVVPQGLILSAVVVLLMLLTTRLGRAAAHRALLTIQGVRP